MTQKLIRNHVKAVKICNYDHLPAEILVKETDKMFTIVSPKCFQNIDVTKQGMPNLPFTLVSWNRNVEYETT